MLEVPQRSWTGRAADLLGDDADGAAVALIAGAAGFVSGIIVSLTVSGAIGDNAKDVLIAGIGGGLGLLTGVSVAFLGFRRSRAADEVRFRREDRHRYAADRHAAFARLLSTGDIARTSTYNAGLDPLKKNVDLASENVDQVTAAQDVAALLASDRVNDAAEDYASSIIAYYNVMIEISDLAATARRKALDGEPWSKAHDEILVQRQRVLGLMRADLGLGRVKPEGGRWRSPRP
jgi:hypothetical protein